MSAVTGNKPHVVAVPQPAQGHVKPLMTLCREIAKHGIKVTFVNVQCIHDRILSAAKMSAEAEEIEDNMVLAAIPDGLTPEDDPNNVFTLADSFFKTIPEALADLIERINASNPNHKVTCLITDFAVDRISDVAHKMEAELVGFQPIPVATLALLHHIPKLLEQGFLDADGNIKNVDELELSDDVPAWRRNELCWSIPGDQERKKLIFEGCKAYKSDNTQWTLSNSCYDLEAGAFELLPHLLPIGPLHLYNSNTIRACSAPSSFYSEDANCMNWLDTKPDGSVIYISFGSTTVLSQQQFDELALGLELSGRAFLWATRPDTTNGSQVTFPDGFLERVGELGKVVDWAPQDEVLSHPSIGCFVSHCGWNSTLEGVGMVCPSCVGLIFRTNIIMQGMSVISGKMD